MSKNFVREIDNINNINKQEFYTNKANDLLSTKEHNYIRKETEEYHCLTDNLKTLSSDNTDLLSVTNYNKTSNTATLRPKHDAQKEQVLTSPSNTLTFKRAANGSNETTKVDVSDDLLDTINNLSEKIVEIDKIEKHRTYESHNGTSENGYSLIALHVVNKNFLLVSVEMAGKYEGGCTLKLTDIGINNNHFLNYLSCDFNINKVNITFNDDLTAVTFNNTGDKTMLTHLFALTGF